MTLITLVAMATADCYHSYGIEFEVNNRGLKSGSYGVVLEAVPYIFYSQILT